MGCQYYALLPLWYPTGYTRILLTPTSLPYMPHHPRTCTTLYTLSSLLDALDGLAARYFAQSTSFGAVLDMITDRCSTTCLLVFLASASPKYALMFQALIALDYSSHYMHMYATLATERKDGKKGGKGRGQRSHKDVDTEWNWALRIYYQRKVRTYLYLASSARLFLDSFAGCLIWYNVPCRASSSPSAGSTNYVSSPYIFSPSHLIMPQLH